MATLFDVFDGIISDEHCLEANRSLKGIYNYAFNGMDLNPTSDQVKMLYVYIEIYIELLDRDGFIQPYMFDQLFRQGLQKHNVERG